MSEPVVIPSFGFARGSIVHAEGSTVNMLVLSDEGERVYVVVIPPSDSSTLRIARVRKSGLRQVLPPGCGELGADAELPPRATPDKETSRG